MKNTLAIFGILLAAASCAANSVSPADTLPGEPGRNACRTTVDVNGKPGTVRYVEGNPARELWDIDSDGVPDFEVRIERDARGRVVSTARVTADGTAVEKIRREWDEDRLVTETGDAFDERGLNRADGTPDWRRELQWKNGLLVAETIDQRDAQMLPGIDGVPEFRIEWQHDAGVRTTGTRFRGKEPVATVVNTWSDGRLVEAKTDFGPDGNVELTERNSYDDQGRLTRSSTEGPEGSRTVEHAYCD